MVLHLELPRIDDKRQACFCRALLRYLLCALMIKGNVN